jgi:hypothetical protein
VFQQLKPSCDLNLRKSISIEAMAKQLGCGLNLPKSIDIAMGESGSRRPAKQLLLMVSIQCSIKLAHQHLQKSSAMAVETSGRSDFLS